VNPNLPTRRISKAERAARVGVALAALAASRHYKFDDLTIEVYSRVLGDLRVDDIEAVCREMERVGEWMPKPSAIRDAVLQRARAARRESLQQIVAGAGPTCALCQDTGWKYVGRGVKPCECRPNNPAFQLARRIGE
jgi:hypothetical protein